MLTLSERAAAAVERIARKHKSRLDKLTISEVSLVDRPANPGARVTFYKREDVAGSPIVKLAKRRAAEAAGDYSDEFEVAKASQSPLVRLAAAQRRRAKIELLRGTMPDEKLNRLSARELDAKVHALRNA